ncbi:MAG TPA: OsmC family protein, partial [Usitatibacteraceae bacterium]|nr:OsmC family protein [Usitatibacteraceae bacterium]
MKARVKLVEGITFLAESGSGHAVVMDASPEVGGRDMGARPMEMVLMGAGGCSAIDVVHILRKARQDLVDCVVEVEGERAAEDPKVFTRIHM